MKIKSKKQKQKQEKTYPYLGETRNDENEVVFVVLFTEMNTGMVIWYNPKVLLPTKQLGYYSRDWDETIFNKFGGELTMSSCNIAK